MPKLVALKMLAPFAAAAMLAAPASAYVGDFEDQSLGDWAVNTPFSDVTDSYGSGSFTAAHGIYFARIDAGLGMDVESTLSRTFSLNMGDRLTGYAGFKANDALPFNDSAHLTINRVDLLSWDVEAVGNYGSSGWTHFSFTAPATGQYTLLLGVANHGDNGWSSFAALDYVRTLPVPEPASWAMLVMGFGFAGGALRNRRSTARLA